MRIYIRKGHYFTVQKSVYKKTITCTGFLRSDGLFVSLEANGIPDGATQCKYEDFSSYSKNIVDMILDIIDLVQSKDLPMPVLYSFEEMRYNQIITKKITDGVVNSNITYVCDKNIGTETILKMIQNFDKGIVSCWNKWQFNEKEMTVVFAPTENNGPAGNTMIFTTLKPMIQINSKTHLKDRLAGTNSIIAHELCHVARNRLNQIEHGVMSRVENDGHDDVFCDMYSMVQKLAVDKKRCVFAQVDDFLEFDTRSEKEEVLWNPKAGYIEITRNGQQNDWSWNSIGDRWTPVTGDSSEGSLISLISKFGIDNLFKVKVIKRGNETNLLNYIRDYATYSKELGLIKDMLKIRST